MKGFLEKKLIKYKFTIQIKLQSVHNM